MPSDDKIITSCYDLTMKSFMACYCDGNLKALNKRGLSAKEPALREAWLKIYSEYVEMMNKGNSTVEVMLAYDIERMTYRYISIVKGLEHLRHTRDDEIVEMIKREGFYYDFNSADREKYLRDILKAEKRAASISVEIQSKKDTLKEITGGDDNKEKTKVDRQYFVSNFTTLSKFNGYRISDAITVAEYITLVNQFIDYQEQLKAKENGRRTN